jgi:ribokinase
MANMAECWIIGPIAWDWPYRVPYLPTSGTFVQAVQMPGRLGGTAANVARALVSRYQPVAMIGYVGRDEYGELSEQDLRTRGIDTSYVETFDGDTSQVLLFIEPSGERTIVGAAEDNLYRVRIPVGAVKAGDLTYFGAWRDTFEPAVGELDKVGAVVASVPFSQPRSELPVSHVVGSISDVPESAVGDPWATYQAWTGGRLRHLTLTQGAGAVRTFSELGCEERPAIRVQAVDSTGAGDAFAAAVLAAMLAGQPVLSGIREGLAWGAATARSEGSIPPAWRQVHEIAGAPPAR